MLCARSDVSASTITRTSDSVPEGCFCAHEQEICQAEDHYIVVHADLGAGKNANDWSVPELLLHKPGHNLWYPSLQPINNPEGMQQKYTSVNLGDQARLFIKDMQPGSDVYQSEYLVQFHR